MSVKSRIPFNIRNRLAFDSVDNARRATLTAALTLGTTDGQFFALDPGGATRVVTLPNEVEEPRGIFVEILNEADAAENLTVQPVIGHVWIDMATNPTATDTLVIAGLTFEFLAAAATVANDANIGVLLGSTAAATLANVVDAINGNVASATGILKAAGTAAERNNSTVPFRADACGTHLVLRYAHMVGGLPTSGASLDLSTNPTDTNTVTIGSDVYEFATAGGSLAADGNIGVVIGGTAAATLTNFIAAINGTATATGLFKTDGVTAALYVGTESVAAATYAGSLLWIYQSTAAGSTNPTTTKTSVALSDTLTAAVNWSAANMNIGPASSVSDTLTSGVSWSSSTVVATQTLRTIYRGEWARFQNNGPRWVLTGYATGSVIEDLDLPATTDITISAGGAATVTEAVHTVRGAGGLADNLDTISGLNDSGLAFFVCGAEAITVRDASVGAGNIATAGNASIVLATGDVVGAFRSGSVVSVWPVSMAAGLPAGSIALARGYMLAGNSSGVAAAVDGGADQGLIYSDGNDMKRGTISAHGATPCTGAAVAQHDATACTGAAVAQHDATACTGAAVGNHAQITTSSNGTETIGRLLPFAVLGAWAVDGDGARTNGGGLVGDTPTLTNAAAAFAVVYDEGTTTYAMLSESNTAMPAIYAANYQVFPDAEAADDAVYFGGTVPFCELALNLSATVGVYANDSCVWEYWSGAAWTAIPAGTFYDNTDTSAPTTGLRPFQQDGAFVFMPPANWASTTVNGQAGYWVRSRVTAAQITTAAVADAVEHDIVTGTEGWRPPHAGNLTAIVVNDNAGTLHTAADVKFVLIDSVTGESRSFTFSQDRRRQRITCTSWALTTAARISCFVYVEDGTNEPTGVVLELEYSLATSNHTHTGTPDAHVVTQPNTPILAHSVTQPNTPALTHTVTQPSTPSLAHTIA